MGDPARGTVRASRPSDYLRAVLAVVVATAAGRAMQAARFDTPNIIMVYLLAVCFVATRAGRGPSALGAVLSVGAFDFFFVPPHLTFAVADTQYVVTFAVMLLVGLLISTLAIRVREEAEAAERERLRSTLLSSVSHDLRTPLGIIEGTASTLLDEEVSLDGATRRELTESIHEQAQRLHERVRDLLDMTRLESGAVELQIEWQSLEELVESALRRVDPLLRGREVSVDLPASLPLVACDGGLLEQVLVNLLENAVKYSAPGSPLEVGARADARVATLTVADRGVGLPAGEETRIFEKFYRPVRDGARPGAGLGLAICRAIVAAHRGAVHGTSREGGGSVFEVTLPLGNPPAAPAESEPFAGSGDR